MNADTPHLQSLCEHVQVISLRVGAYIREEQKKLQHNQIEQKGRSNFVTHVDKQAEQFFVDALKPIFPEAGFITEEDDSRERKSQWNWVIDPLDGTTNFIHGVPFYATSVALLRNDIPVLGVIYEINMDECFYAWENGGAWMNGQKISCSSASSISEALIGTGFPYSDAETQTTYMRLFTDLQNASHGMRRPGSAATDMAYVACGRFDAFYEYGLSAWDVAAGCVLVVEAGGAVSDFNGKANFVFGKQLICGTKAVQQELQKTINAYFPNFNHS
ncbi:MAG: inositol monophosphatase family protein [Bacteroidia bacterium]